MITTSKLPRYFRLEDIQDDDYLIRFYTGFGSFMILMAFFEFLGPVSVVHELNFWGRKRSQQWPYSRKLDPLNQLFLMLGRLRLNLKMKDLAFRFGISASSVSHYITTWICFLWTPSVEQVLGTLPHSFRQQFPTTLQSLMAVKSLYRLLLICMFNLQLGASTNTITQ